MPTIAERFYTTANVDDQTYSGEASIRKLEEAAGSGTSAVTWSATGVQTRTIRPTITNEATNSDTSQNNGWAFNNGGADGLGSTSTEKRFIPAGVWDFSLAMSVTAAPLLTSIPSTTLTAKVYRVATGGGTRTLLFTAAPAAFTASATITFSSASQPQYTLEAGEVIMVGFIMTSQAIAAVLFSNPTPVTWTLTNGSNTWIDVPAPGVRTLFLRSYTGSHTPGAGSIIKKPTLLLDSNVGSSSGVIIKTVRRFESAVMPGAGVVFKQPIRRFASSIASAAAVFKRPTRIITSTQTPGPSSRITFVTFHVEGTVASSSVVSRGLFRFYQGSIASAGQPFKRAYTHYASTVGSSSQVFKRPTRIIASTHTPGPSQLIRMPVRIFTSTITPAAERVYFIVKKFPVSTIASAGQVFKRYMPQPYASSITPGPGTLTRRPIKLLQSAITSSSTMQALLRKNFTASITPTGNVTKTLFSFFTGTITSASTIFKRINRFFSGLIGPTEDWAVINPTKQIAGIVKDQGGTPVSGATVKLFRVADDAFIASTTSGGSGEYSFVRDQNDPNFYFVVAYEEVGTPTQGLTVRNLFPTVIP